MNLKTVGLFGAKSTMTHDFYEKIGNKYGLKIVTPNTNEINYIHSKYMTELIYNDIRKDTKLNLIKIAERLQEKESIEALIIGGTELYLILNQNDFDSMHLLDTALIHIDAI